jgi:MOSC domain-containing protein YiiM
MAEIVSIWIKRAHRLPMERVDEAQLVAGRGLVGNADQGRWRQVTIIDEGAWRQATEELGMDVDPSARRANVMIRGLDLEGSRGRKLILGDCVINIRGENPPCRMMDQMQKFLKPHWRAGIFGEIVEGGTIRVGDEVAFEGL